MAWFGEPSCRRQPQLKSMRPPSGHLKPGQFLGRLDNGLAVVDGELLTAISTDVDEIIAIVALALTLDRDPELQIELPDFSGVGESETLSLELPGLSDPTLMSASHPLQTLEIRIPLNR